MFLGAGKTNHGVLFAVDVLHGKDIKDYSFYKSEAEILVAPATAVLVKNKMTLPGGTELINLDEVGNSLAQLLGLSSDDAPSVTGPISDKTVPSTICRTGGCSRVTWNGQPNEDCCRACRSTGGSSHGPDFNKKRTRKGNE